MIAWQKTRKWSRLAPFIVMTLFLFGLLFAFTTNTASAQDDMTATTNARLNFREGPGSGHAIMQTLDVNTEVTFTGFRDQSGEWVQVRLTDGTVGWVSAQFLSNVPNTESLQVWQDDSQEVDTAPEVTFSSAVVTATTTVNLNLRSEPGRGSQLLETLEAGTVVGFTGFMDGTGEWVQVDAADGALGWVSAQYLSNVPDELQVRPADLPPMTDQTAAGETTTDAADEETAAASEFSSAVVTTTTTVNLNIRSGPGTGHALLDTLPAGTVVGFTGYSDATGNWVMVDAATGPVGWVAAQYLSFVPADLLVWEGDTQPGA